MEKSNFPAVTHSNQDNVVLLKEQTYTSMEQSRNKPYISGHWIFDKDAKAVQWGEEQS